MVEQRKAHNKIIFPMQNYLYEVDPTIILYTHACVLLTTRCRHCSMTLLRGTASDKLSCVALVCAVFGACLYVNTLDCGLCFDDVPVLKKNPDVATTNTSLHSWINLLRNDFWGTPMDDPDSHKSYRPLTVATFRLNYLLHELEPMGYHLVNVALHSVVCYLYVQLCGLVFAELWPALVAGLLFAVHPVHTEAVSRLH